MYIILLAGPNSSCTGLDSSCTQQKQHHADKWVFLGGKCGLVRPKSMGSPWLSICCPRSGRSIMNTNFQRDCHGHPSPFWLWAVLGRTGPYSAALGRTRPHGPAPRAPSQIFARLRLSSSPFFFGTKILAPHLIGHHSGDQIYPNIVYFVIS